MKRIARLLTLALLLGWPALAQDKRPNIIFIMVDDLGNADLGYRGGQIKTPNLDALAQGGVRLESFYGMPLCTPSRAALMTGRYPMRYGLQTGVIFPAHTYGLPTDERTLPQALKDAGYRTYMVGKWHLGHADRKYWPQNRGFDSFYGCLGEAVDYFKHDRGGVIDWQRNGKFLKEDGYFMNLIGDEAVGLLQEQDGKRPFFLYFASLATHQPYQVPAQYLARYPDIQDKQRQTYAAMASCLDDEVGRMVAVLDKKGLRDNTLIVFASDNGGLRHSWTAADLMYGKVKKAPPPASNAPYRGGKGGLLEGGSRVVAFANWPGKLTPAVIQEPLHMVDVMPTLVALAGGQASSDHPFDGKNVWPVLAQGQPGPHEDLLINVEMFRGAVRKGDWKLIKTATLPSKNELYNLAQDPGEKNNLAQQHPEIAKDLEARLEAYARQQKMSLWIKAQPAFLGVQGKAVIDPEYDLDDELPVQKLALPR